MNSPIINEWLKRNLRLQCAGMEMEIAHLRGVLKRAQSSFMPDETWIAKKIIDDAVEEYESAGSLEQKEGECDRCHGTGRARCDLDDGETAICEKCGGNHSVHVHLFGSEPIAAGTSSATSALRYAQNIATEMAKSFPSTFGFCVFDDLELVLSQIDNMAAGFAQRLNAIPQGGEIVSGSAREAQLEAALRGAVIALGGWQCSCTPGAFRVRRELLVALGPHSDGTAGRATNAETQSPALPLPELEARGVICEHGKTILSIDECPECEAKIRSILAPARDGASDHPPRRTNQHE